MRFTTPALNNDYYDEDYLKAFNFKSIGKNVKVHRSVVFMKPASISIGSNVTIDPYCVYGEGTVTIEDGEHIYPFTYAPGDVTPSLPELTEEKLKRLAELEAMMKAKDE